MYMPSGHVVFWDDGALWSAPFDLEQLEMAGEPISMITAVGWRGRALFDRSGDGSAYFVETAVAVPNELVWLTPTGTEQRLEVAGSHMPRVPTPALSPDGTTLLKLEPGTRLWLHDIKRGISERLTDGTSAEWIGLWRPDGAEIIFTSRRSGPFDIYRIPTRGPKIIDRVGTDGGTPQDWTADGRLLYTKEGLRTWSFDSRTSTLILDEPVRRVRMSPDGQFIAYQVPADGSEHVYVRRFPDVQAARWRVIGSSASNPEWSPDGRTLYFIESKAIMAVEVSPSNDVPVGTPRLLFKGPYVDVEVARDGRILAIREAPPPSVEAADKIIVVQNWTTELQRLSKTH
jgi:dipeptidyl aminopeptidase/acylaminoacyl peptidase